MPTLNDIVDLIFKNEVDPNDPGKVTNDPTDKGGRTAYGISERANPQAWADGKVDEAEARTIYIQKYVKRPKFDQIQDGRLLIQLVDFGVHSGPQLTIMKLQAILGFKGDEIDGIIGPKTLAALETRDARMINNQLAGERIRMLGRIVIRDKSQLGNLTHWLYRATEFIW